MCESLYESFYLYCVIVIYWIAGWIMVEKIFFFFRKIGWEKNISDVRYNFRICSFDYYRIYSFDGFWISITEELFGNERIFQDYY